jgi:hypothetical protein
MSDVRAAQSESKQRWPSVRDNLLLALLPTATVLPMVAVLEAFGRDHLMCSSLASSAYLIYADPGHEINGARFGRLADDGGRRGMADVAAARRRILSRGNSNSAGDIANDSAQGGFPVCYGSLASRLDGARVRYASRTKGRIRLVRHSSRDRGPARRASANDVVVNTGQDTERSITW